MRGESNPPTDFFPIHNDDEKQKLEALTHYHIFDEVSRAFDEGFHQLVENADECLLLDIDKI